eukprot:5219350-Pyramimonas_sp.AAC.1
MGGAAALHKRHIDCKGGAVALHKRHTASYRLGCGSPNSAWNHPLWMGGASPPTPIGQSGVCTPVTLRP